MKPAVIWDCDGVLVDSEKFSCGAWLPVLARRGIEAELADIEAFIGRSDGAVLEHYQRAGHDLGLDLLDEKEQEYRNLARGALETFAGLPPLLAHLREEDRPMAVASSGRLEKIRFSLAETRLDGFFDILCSATEVVRGKPAPDLFLLAARRLAIDPAACVVIEDSVPGIEAAVSAGMRGFGFTSSHDASDLASAGAAATFDTYDDLSRMLA